MLDSSYYSIVPPARKFVAESLFEKSGTVLEKGYFGVNALRTYLKKKKVV